MGKEYHGSGGGQSLRVSVRWYVAWPLPPLPLLSLTASPFLSVNDHISGLTGGYGPLSVHPWLHIYLSPLVRTWLHYQFSAGVRDAHQQEQRAVKNYQSSSLTDLRKKLQHWVLDFTKIVGGHYASTSINLEIICTSNGFGRSSH